ncbi:hypothetical protein TrVFT333_011640 [Trichoderma virens FT-333]|nr:hypothetical protein TrVFT333_011640 [Trichoderma virens FT-333]
MNRSSWAEGRALGIRFYLTLARYMPHYANRDEIEEICTAIDGFIMPYRYPDLVRDTRAWFFEFQEAAWEGLWEHAEEYCRQLDNGLVDDIEGERISFETITLNLWKNRIAISDTLGILPLRQRI